MSFLASTEAKTTLLLVLMHYSNVVSTMLHVQVLCGFSLLHNLRQRPEYVLVIDSGSSGTRM